MLGLTRRPEPAAPEPDARAQERLRWLLDAPLFVDEPLVDRLFDAVVRPEYDVQSREVGEMSEVAWRRLFGSEYGAEYKVGIPFLTGTGGVSGRRSRQDERSAKWTLSSKEVRTPIVTAGRKLEEIATVYASSHPDRAVMLDLDGMITTFSGATLEIDDLELSAGSPPRMLVFLLIDPGSAILPMACETESGTTKLLYPTYGEKVLGSAPTFPSGSAATRETKDAYWDALFADFSSRQAMEVLEEGATEAGGRLAWVDFRVRGHAVRTLHLHCVPDGKFHTGVFGYNLVNRGHKQGIRVLGTLKAGLDVNVLAIFDR